jgi:hypothetical protein
MRNTLTFLRLNMVEEISSDHWYSHRGHSFFTCQYLKYITQCNRDVYRDIFNMTDINYTVASSQFKCFKIHTRNRLTNKKISWRGKGKYLRKYINL